jgi:protocatechuate 3,4-dioxygenase beta subunit
MPPAASRLTGAAVYVWHCDRVGNYSLYSPEAVDENYLRGVQTVGSDGTATFTSIFPGAYPGRWPHIHFEVYPSVDDAVAAGSPNATSQVALPEDACTAVYATAGYEQSVTNFGQTSLPTDLVFRDGWEEELGKVTGSAATGMRVTLAVPV